MVGLGVVGGEVETHYLLILLQAPLALIAQSGQKRHISAVFGDWRRDQGAFGLEVGVAGAAGEVALEFAGLPLTNIGCQRLILQHHG